MLLGKTPTLAERIEKIEQVTPADLLEVGKLLVKDTVYLLDVER
jgi:predicted Zn-dependent peptidase